MNRNINGHLSETALGPRLRPRKWWKGGAASGARKWREVSTGDLMWISWVFHGIPRTKWRFLTGKIIELYSLAGAFYTMPCLICHILMARYDCNNLSPSSCIKWWYSYHPARHGSIASVVSWVDRVDQLLTLPWSKLPWGYSSVSSNRGGWGFPFSESPREDCRQWRF